MTQHLWALSGHGKTGSPAAQETGVAGTRNDVRARHQNRNGTRRTTWAAGLRDIDQPAWQNDRWQIEELQLGNGGVVDGGIEV